MAFYETLKLEKGMYSAPGKSFTQALEELDPSENYRGTPLEGLDAYQRQLKRFDIRVSGPGSDLVEKFFQTSDSTALFPEYVSRAVRQGMEQADLLPNLVATVTNIAGMDYRTLSSEPSDDDKSLKPVAEGAVLPQTTVTTKDHLVHLYKRGRMLVASYEALRFQKLDLFTVTLRQIGAYIARAQLQDAMNVLVNGDDGDSTATNIGTAGGAVDYAGLVSLWAGLAPYQLNTMLASTTTMQQILALSQMCDAQAGLNFQGTGKMITPLGATLLHAPSLTAKGVIGLDKTCALEMVQAGGVTTDYDKLIDRQLERASISVIAGFSRIFDGAVKPSATRNRNDGDTSGFRAVCPTDGSRGTGGREIPAPVRECAGAGDGDRKAGHRDSGRTGAVQRGGCAGLLPLDAAPRGSGRGGEWVCSRRRAGDQTCGGCGHGPDAVAGVRGRRRA